MPSRKQRRRREKLQRHEYEYVLETEEGEEIPLRSPRPRPAEQSAPGRGEPARGRNTGQIPRPSLQRVLKRALIFGPVLFVVVYITSPGFTLTQQVAQTIFLLALFMPFSYLVDVLVYRLLLRRAQRHGQGG